MSSSFKPLFFLFLGAASLHAADPFPLLPADRAGGYVLVWHDEFDGDKLDESQWAYRTGDRFGSHNQAANVSVSDGLLKLAVRKEKAGLLDYTSGGIISKREFKYGYYEARFQVPATAGWHTSFWTMKNSPDATGAKQEIDIVEQDSRDPVSYNANLHIHAPEHKGLGGLHVATPNLARGFHFWGCEFLPTEIRYYFEGKLVLTKDITAFPHDTQSIWLTVVGWENLPWSPQTKIDPAGLPASANFDYVRFFEKPAAKSDVP